MNKILALFFMFLFTAPLLAINKSTYRIALRTLPEKIHPREIEVNVHFYVASQLYYPLFYSDDSGVLKSKFLDLNKTKAIDLTFTKYFLCLKSGLTFNNGRPITVADFENSLRQSHKNIDNLMDLASLSKDGSCLTAELKHKDPRYFDKLTHLSSTIISNNSKNNVAPLGLGPYKISTFSSNKIVLERVSANKKSISKIEFIKFTNAAEMLKQGIHDWNHIYHLEIPQSIKDSYQAINRPLTKSYIVLSRINSKKERLNLMKCLPIKDFIKAVQLPLSSIPGYLPQGMEGFNVDFGKIRHDLNYKCLLDSKKADVKLYYYNKDITPSLDLFFSKHQSKLPFKISPTLVEVNDLIDMLFKSSKEFIAVIGLEASGKGVEEFFKYLLNKPKMIIGSIPELFKVFNKAKLSSLRVERKRLFSDAHEIVLKEGYFIPLGQYVSTLYYPKWVTNIRWIDKGQGFPQLWELEIK